MKKKSAEEWKKKRKGEQISFFVFCFNGNETVHNKRSNISNVANSQSLNKTKFSANNIGRISRIPTNHLYNRWFVTKLQAALHFFLKTVLNYKLAFISSKQTVKKTFFHLCRRTYWWNYSQSWKVSWTYFLFTFYDHWEITSSLFNCSLEGIQMKGGEWMGNEYQTSSPQNSLWANQRLDKN